MKTEWKDINHKLPISEKKKYLITIQYSDQDDQIQKTVEIDTWYQRSPSNKYSWDFKKYSLDFPDRNLGVVLAYAECPEIFQSTDFL